MLDDSGLKQFDESGDWRIRWRLPIFPFIQMERSERHTTNHQGSS